MAEKFLGGVRPGQTNVTIAAFFRSTADNSELTGLEAADITAYYWRQGGTQTSITVSDLTAIDDAHSDGGFKETDSTNMPGLYRFDVPDAAYAAGADWVVVSLKAAGAFVYVERFNISSNPADLVAIDGNPTNDNSATLKLKKLECINPDVADYGVHFQGKQAGMRLEADGPSGNALYVVSQGAQEAIYIVGGATSDAVGVLSSSGAGISITSPVYGMYIDAPTGVRYDGATVSDPVQPANLVAIDGNPTNDNSATLKLKTLEIMNTEGMGVSIYGQSQGVAITGNDNEGVLISGDASGVKIIGGDATGIGNGINIIGGSTSGDGISVTTTDGIGIGVTSGGVGKAGAVISGDVGLSISGQQHGISIGGNTGNGLAVSSANSVGIMVTGGTDGVQVIAGDNAGDGNGISVFAGNTSGDAIRAEGFGGNAMNLITNGVDFPALRVRNAVTGPGIEVTTAGGDGVNFTATGGDGLRIVSTDQTGVFISSEWEGLSVSANLGNAVYLRQVAANDDRGVVRIRATGLGGGIEIETADGDGIHVAADGANRKAVRLSTIDGDGVAIVAQGATRAGVTIASTGGHGVKIDGGTGGYSGVSIYGQGEGEAAVRIANTGVGAGVQVAVQLGSTDLDIPSVRFSIYELLTQKIFSVPSVDIGLSTYSMTGELNSDGVYQLYSVRIDTDTMLNHRTPGDWFANIDNSYRLHGIFYRNTLGGITFWKATGTASYGDFLLLDNNRRAGEETVWAADTAFTRGQIVSGGGSWHVCDIAGTSGLVEPTWNAAAGDTTVDGGITWQCISDTLNTGVFTPGVCTVSLVQTGHTVATINASIPVRRRETDIIFGKDGEPLEWINEAFTKTYGTNIGMDVNVVAINGNPTNDYSATLALKQLDIRNTGGDPAVNIMSADAGIGVSINSDSNGIHIITGAGGDGVQVTGGKRALMLSAGQNDPCVYIEGGITSGDGIKITTTDGHGISVLSDGLGKRGVNIVSSHSNGLHCQSLGTGSGISAIADGGGPAIGAVSNTGEGMKIEGYQKGLLCVSTLGVADISTGTDDNGNMYTTILPVTGGGGAQIYEYVGTVMQFNGPQPVFRMVDLSGAPITGLVAADFTVTVYKKGQLTGVVMLDLYKSITEDANGYYTFATNDDSIFFDVPGITKIIIESAGAQTVYLACNVVNADGGDANLVSINGNPVTDYSAVLRLRQLDIQSPDDVAFRARGGGANPGAQFEGGETGRGLEVLGGPTSGDGAMIQSPSSGIGLRVQSSGNSPAVRAVGSGTGSGMEVAGGATGDGVTVQGGGTSGRGVIVATSDGHGVEISSGGAGKVDILATKDVAISAITYNPDNTYNTITLADGRVITFNYAAGILQGVSYS